MKIKNYITVILASSLIFGLSGYMLLRQRDDYSYSERRALAQLPSVSIESLRNGEFMTDFESFSQDQFPMRDSFRTVKAVVNRYGLFRLDNHRFYSAAGHLSKLEYPLSDELLSTNLDKLHDVYEQQIAESDCKVYLSVIPDKNYFIARENAYPAMDYEKMIETVEESMDYAVYIPIFDLLCADDYYRTDQHWRQERIMPIARALADGMGASVDMDLSEVELPTPFYGTYYSQAALPFHADTLSYMTGAAIDGCTVKSYNTGKPVDVLMYDIEKSIGRDGYEMFLNGSDALIVIENPAATSEKELVVFRDSFSSSLMPLMASGYKKITLIDLRYMQKELVSSFVDFEGQDVLFLYSTLVLNNIAVR